MFMMVCFFFFFKQKTAYEMRISDWSSDVCSSDLPVDRRRLVIARIAERERRLIARLRMNTGRQDKRQRHNHRYESNMLHIAALPDHQPTNRGGGLGFFSGIEIGRASCRERVCQYV